MNKELIELRQVITKLVPLLTGKGLVVSQRGSQAYVAVNTHTKKPERVNIPSVPDNATPDFVRAIQGFIDHEVAHVLITNFDHYLVKDAHFNPKAKRLQNLINQVEDTMIEREIVKIFPGSARNIHDLRVHYNDKISKPVVDELRALVKAGKRTEQDLFVAILIIVLRAMAGHEEMQQFMDDEKLWEQRYVKHFVDTLSPVTKKALPFITTTKEARAIAEEVERILYPSAPPPVVSAVDPAEGDPKGGYEVTIEGDNFVDVMGVSFGEKPCAKYKPIGKNKLVVIAPKGSEGEVVDITVTTSHGSGTLPGAFKYVTPPPPPPSPPQESEDSDEGEGEEGEGSEGESKDKPEKEAGEGSGTGERDHSEQEDGDEGDE
ncbi:IPT/TIG domain-containing protein, partial [Mesorhizobium sp. M0320]|uniref:IPT/TIG domain-containing protein n=1 Tax=Mesorhizobium sp. M0320 TaxID=2956936 RepID=UPI0033365670